MLASGTRLGPYEIVAPVGQGGMGTVYRARDPRLGRDVAIKVSAERFSERFEREARAVAALNHPNVCTLYDVGPDYLVMEFVEGESPHGRLPLDEALRVAGQIAAALEAAHECGIVHRDLKPGNVKIRTDGTVKVLDFGLAKALAPDPSSPATHQQSLSPTLSLHATQAGVILGTAGYMSPEQARGQPVDKRTDIWAFGVLLYEMSTGARLFQGDTVSDTLAAVLTKEPDWKQAPARIQRLLRRCLERDPKRRLRDIGDAMALVDDPLPIPAPASSRWWKLAAAAAVAALATVVVLFWPRVEERPLVRLDVDLGPDTVLDALTVAVISPDGTRIVFPARDATGKELLATRLLSESDATLLAGTEGGTDPFFSPDGQWLGFFTTGGVKKISVHGGAPVTLCSSCTATGSRGGSWGEGGTIVAALGSTGGLVRLPDSGGEPRPLTELQAGEVTHRWPQILPGGQVVIFTAHTAQGGFDEASVDAQSLLTGERQTLMRGGYFARYLPTSESSGHLVYVREGALYGVRFDPVELEARGAPALLFTRVAGDAGFAAGRFDFSAAPSEPGTFVYLNGEALQTWPLSWMTGSGPSAPLVPEPAEYYSPRFSPDGRRLAFSMNTGQGLHVFVRDIEREVLSRLTFAERGGVAPTWAPDGAHIAFASARSLSWVRADGSGEVRQLVELAGRARPFSFSPDGRQLAYSEEVDATGADLWILPLDLNDPDRPRPGKPELFLKTPANEIHPAFSPDGRWMAYGSDESGGFELYVRPALVAGSAASAGAGGKWQISTAGGRYPMWSQTARELFYESPAGHIMVAQWSASGSSFTPGQPRRWSEARTKRIPFAGLYDSLLALAPDGKRFAGVPLADPASSDEERPHVTFLLNFFDELRRRLPER